MPSYSDFRALVRDWSNKDSSVLSDDRINDCMRYAADNSYRRLRISALEQTVTYSQRRNPNHDVFDHRSSNLGFALLSTSGR